MTLLHLKNGQSSQVLHVEEAAGCYDRLMELGFTAGESIRVLRRAPLGGPIQVEVRGTSYAIGSDDARHIKVVL